MSLPARVGPWEILEELGSGGNAIVYLARRIGSQDKPIALKVLNSRNIESEPYLRFVNEVKALRRVGDDPGVLPVLDVELPERLNRRSPAWLTMPRANRIDNALADASVEEIVAAVRTVAETLVRLKVEHGIGHRDIKPGNLYELDGAYLVGDFGLVALPDAATLTVQGKAMGPTYFAPYEMRLNAATADPHPADVYSLAKTLWVLMTTERYPPDGHQVVGTVGRSLVELRPHAGASELDQLIDRATVARPEARPTMEQFARDLRIWSEVSPMERPPLDVSGAVARFRAAAAEQIGQQEERIRFEQAANRIKERIIEGTRPFDNALGELRAPRSKYRATYDERIDATLTVSGAPGVQWMRWVETTLVGAEERVGALALRIARGFELYSTGMLYPLFRVEVTYEGLSSAPRPYLWQLGLLEASADSLECERNVDRALAEMGEAVPIALDAFIAALEKQGG